MAEINLIKIDGKPLEKLIDVISKGIGTMYRPKAIRKEADAKAYEIELIERAKSKALAEGREIEADVCDRIQERLLNKETKRQNNIDTVASIAAEELKDEKTVSEEPVNEDWSTRYFNIVEDISDHEMQTIWGRILASEVKKPNSYSLRTLEFLKNLSKNEALTFVKVANLSLFGSGKNYVFDPDNGKYLEENHQIKFADIMQLRELGLLSPDADLVLQLVAPVADDKTYIRYHNKVIILERKVGAPEQTLKALVFTSIAMELLQLVQPTIEMTYIKRIKKHLMSEKVVVKLGDIVNTPVGEKVITNIKDIED